MTIKLDSNDISTMVKKITSILKSNDTRNTFMDIKVERYGIPFKVSISKENDNHYVIDEVSYYGVNTNNIYVTYESSTTSLYGNIFL